MSDKSLHVENPNQAPTGYVLKKNISVLLEVWANLLLCIHMQAMKAQETMSELKGLSLLIHTAKTTAKQ